jgi:CheY-like chemotaxis protein
MCSRILIIEDNPTNLELMDYLLKSSGHEVLAAMDGALGLELAQREAPDLIICDIQIPKVDGFGVARHLKASDTLRHIPLVAITAFAMVGDRERMLAGGFDEYVAKPIDPQAFVAQMEAFLKFQPPVLTTETPKKRADA